LAPCVVAARSVNGSDSQFGSLLGPHFSDGEMRRFFDIVGARYQTFTNEDELLCRVADLLASEKVVGWLHGPHLSWIDL